MNQDPSVQISGSRLENSNPGPNLDISFRISRNPLKNIRPGPSQGRHQREGGCTRSRVDKKIKGRQIPNIFWRLPQFYFLPALP